MMTLEDVENIPKEFLLASDIAPFLNTTSGTIHFYAKSYPELLGFAVIVMGKRVRIPKRAFIHYCRNNPPGIPLFDSESMYHAYNSIECAKNERIERDKIAKRPY